jgi:hypothetical protein
MRTRSFRRYLKSSLIRVIAGTGLIVVAVLLATRPQIKTQYCDSRDNQPNSIACPKVDDDKILGVGPDGWTAIFTGVLALFTAVLTSVSFIQIRFLIKADETARISADAAKQSADVAERFFGTSIRALYRCRDNPKSHNSP